MSYVDRIMDMVEANLWQILSLSGNRDGYFCAAHVAQSVDRLDEEPDVLPRVFDDLVHEGYLESRMDDHGCKWYRTVEPDPIRDPKGYTRRVLEKNLDKVVVKSGRKDGAFSVYDLGEFSGGLPFNHISIELDRLVSDGFLVNRGHDLYRIAKYDETWAVDPRKFVRAVLEIFGEEIAKSSGFPDDYFSEVHVAPFAPELTVNQVGNALLALLRPDSIDVNTPLPDIPEEEKAFLEIGRGWLLGTYRIRKTK